MDEQALMQGPPRMMSAVALAAALALALWAWLPADDEVVGGASGKAGAQPGSPSARSSVSLDWRTPATAPPAAWSALAFAATAFAVPLTVAAPQKLQVGEMNDLVVGVGRNSGVGEVSFTVRFDPDVLQARVGTEGDWASGAGGDERSFAAEISDAGDLVQIRRSVSDQRVSMAGGSVASVQFQAVASGMTSVTITDIMVKDWAGRPMGSLISASNLQVTVDSFPPPQPEASRQLRPTPVDSPAEAVENGD